MRKIAALALGFVAMLSFVSVAFAQGSTATVTASADINSVCIFTPGVIDFGSLNPGATSAVVTETLSNTGNNPVTTVSVSGGDWSYGSGTVGNTQWSASSTTPFTNSLSGTATSTGVTVPKFNSASLYWLLNVPTSATSGHATQLITFTIGCE